MHNRNHRGIVLIMAHIVHSYGLSMPTSEYRIGVMSVIAAIAGTLALLHRPWLTLDAQLILVSILAGLAAMESLWSP